METKETTVPLPEELVERILGMVPFPQVFKARTLSKSWLARLSPPSSLRKDQEKKRLAISFQKRMGEFWSRTWKTFCPVLLSRDDLRAYDRESDHWRTVLDLSFLPQNHHPTMTAMRTERVEIEGVLVLISATPDADSESIGNLLTTEWRSPYSVSIGNILTKQWRKLSLRRYYHPGPIAAGSHLVSHPSSPSYKVIVFYEEKEGRYVAPHHAMVYDPMAWSDKSVSTPHGVYIRSNRMSFNGTNYWVVGPMRTQAASDLIAFDFEKEVFHVLQMQPNEVPMEADSFYLVVCNGAMTMVLSMDDGERFMKSVRLVEIDLESRRWLEVIIRVPFPERDFRFFRAQPASDGGDRIFFLGSEAGIVKVLAYSVPKEQWSYAPVPETVSPEIVSLTGVTAKGYRLNPAFQPGLNPFQAVE
ncbi:unnamed protein product [Calypogeia fissa]